MGVIPRSGAAQPRGQNKGMTWHYDRHCNAGVTFCNLRIRIIRAGTVKTVLFYGKKTISSPGYLKFPSLVSHYTVVLPSSAQFDRLGAVMVAQRYDLRLETREIRVRTLPRASSGHVTTMSPQHLRSRMPVLTFATKKLSTGANGQKEDAASFFCARSFDRAFMIKVAHGSGCWQARAGD